MNIYWSQRALVHLESIYTFCIDVYDSEYVAAKLYNEILDETEVLETFPLAGKVEPLLNDMSICYRSLVVKKHYKIIYFISEDDIIYVSAVWDCRMNPKFLKDNI